MLDGDPAPLPQKGGSSAPQFSAHFYCGQTAGMIKMPLGTKVGLSPGDSVLDGDPAPLPTKGVEPPPQFSAHFYCGQTAGCIKMPFGMEAGAELPQSLACLLWLNSWIDQDVTWHGSRPWSSPHCARWERSPKFSAHLYCGQTAGCIKMPLGTEVGLGLRDVVFDVDPATPRKRAHPPHPIFGPCLLWPNGWMDEDATWYRSRPGPSQIVLDRVPAPAKGAQQHPPLFSAHVCCGHSRPSQLLLTQLLFYLLRFMRYKAKCVKTRCLQEGVGHLESRFQGEMVVPLPIC